jgi:hypothetical protein
MAADVEQILSTLPDDVKIIPGHHGPLGDKASETLYNDLKRVGAGS